MKKYQGSCHCGKVAFEADTDLSQVITCNCSHCAIKGFLLTFVPASQFTLHSGEDELTEYLFNKKSIHHLFCRTCGVQTFGRGTDKEGNATYAVNVRTLHGVDVAAIETMPYNGKDM